MKILLVLMLASSSLTALPPYSQEDYEDLQDLLLDEESLRYHKYHRFSGMDIGELMFLYAVNDVSFCLNFEAPEEEMHVTHS